MRGRTRRAISSIVTSAILLTSTVIMGTGLVTWSNGSLASYQSSLSNTFSTNVNKLNEDLSIENVWFGNSPPKFLNVTATNTGTLGVNVTDITLKTSSSTTDTQITHAGILPKQQYSTIINYNWQSGTPIQITITTSRGTTFTSQVMPP